MSRSIPLHRFTSLAAQVASMFRSARIGYWTHARLLEERDATLFAHPDYKLLTRYELGYIRGAWDSLVNETYNRDLEWAFDVGAELPVKLDEATQEQRALILTESDKRGHHYWKGTAKPFT